MIEKIERKEDLTLLQWCPQALMVKQKNCFGPWKRVTGFGNDSLSHLQITVRALSSLIFGSLRSGLL